MEALQRLHNRGSISTASYEIDNSLKFEADNTEYLSKTPSSAGNRRTWTLSVWIKRTELASGASMQILSAGDTYLHFDADKLKANFRSAGTNFFFATNRVFRDTSAWYHIVLQCDTTQGTDTNRAKLWVNGESQTADWLNSYSNMSQNYETLMNNDNAHRVGMYLDGSTPVELFNGYMAEMHLVDGTALEPTSFGEFDDNSGIWKPKAYAGSHGTNGFYLDFKDSANLGNDASGGTDFAETNIAAADQATDTPTNNFATFNVAQPRASGTTIAEGGTEMYINSNYQTAVSSIAVSKGKWYAEFIPGSHTCYVGFVDVLEWTIPQLHNGYFLGYSGIGNTLSVGMKGTDGVILNESNSATGATFGNTDIISVALDMDNRKAYFAVNGTYVNSGNPATAANPILWYTQRDDGTPWTDVITMGITGYTNTYHRCNFGGYSSVAISSAASDANGYGTFEYAPPSGFYALCSKNLAEYG